MSGHGANPYFFNKKSKGWTSRTLVKPPPPYGREHLIFALAPSYFNVDVKCVSPLFDKKRFLLPNHRLAENLILIFGFYYRKTKE